MLLSKAQQRIIRGTMISKGVTNATIVDRTGVTDNYVTFVVTGRRKGYRVRRAIAEACGVAYSFLWPDEEEPACAAA